MLQRLKDLAQKEYPGFEKLIQQIEQSKQEIQKSKNETSENIASAKSLSEKVSTN